MIKENNEEWEEKRRELKEREETIKRMKEKVRYTNRQIEACLFLYI